MKQRSLELNFIASYFLHAILTFPANDLTFLFPIGQR
jgi:hypothetical protein